MLIQNSIRVGLLKLNSNCLEPGWTKDIFKRGIFYFWHVLTCQRRVTVVAIIVLKFSTQNEPPLLFAQGKAIQSFAIIMPMYVLIQKFSN